ncbi:hypothetical protein, partial [Streptomyces sp. NPDC056358]|uniref:hypothetical protein n=1 Tax=Streptomyces sp. NPDC056358 TaxID=3345794 RepID=UPI0035D831BB
PAVLAATLFLTVVEALIPVAAAWLTARLVDGLTRGESTLTGYASALRRPHPFTHQKDSLR